MPVFFGMSIDDTKLHCGDQLAATAGLVARSNETPEEFIALELLPIMCQLKQIQQPSHDGLQQMLRRVKWNEVLFDGL